MDKQLEATLARLYRLRASDIKLGLETMSAILDQLGNPERGRRFIHVAGTNGKGSVCAMIESALRAAGVRTGLYTSPHLVRFNERIRVDGRCIKDDELAMLIARVEQAADDAARKPGGRHATFFELTSAICFEHFRNQDVDIAVIETGLGGRLDATNVIDPLVTVITSIALEHTAWLGADIPSIAREKCGIIKPGRPVITGGLPAEAMAVVREIARERGARLVEAAGSVSIQLLAQDQDGTKVRIESASASYGTMTIPLPGSKTLENAAIAIAALEALPPESSIEIRPDVMKKGLQQVIWPGRFQLLSHEPPVIVDGSHNPQAGRALADALAHFFPRAPIGLVFGMASDKDLSGFLRSFSGMVKKFWAVPIRSDRSLPPEIVAAKARSLGWDAEESTVLRALQDAAEWAGGQGGVICITGSFFLAGEVLEIRYGEKLFE